MANKIKFKINKNTFADLIDKLSDLTAIDGTIKMKIDNEDILLYSTLGGNVMLAFKNYLVKRKDYLEFDGDIEHTYDIIISNSKTFVKNLDFIKDSDKITMELNCKESPDDPTVMNGRGILVTGGKLKVNWPAGERYEMRDITKSILKTRLDIKKRKWKFDITKPEFTQIKKLSSINSDKIINITVTNGSVVLSEKSAWELQIGDIETHTANMILNKRFLSSINDKSDVIEFNMFDTFILVKDHNSNLMLSYEQDFSDDDV